MQFKQSHNNRKQTIYTISYRLLLLLLLYQTIDSLLLHKRDSQMQKSNNNEYKTETIIRKRFQLS